MKIKILTKHGVTITEHSDSHCKQWVTMSKPANMRIAELSLTLRESPLPYASTHTPVCTLHSHMALEGIHQ